MLGKPTKLMARERGLGGRPGGGVKIYSCMLQKPGTIRRFLSCNISSINFESLKLNIRAQSRLWQLAIDFTAQKCNDKRLIG